MNENLPPLTHDEEASNKVYGAADKLRKQGGGIWLDLHGSTRRERRDNITRLGGMNKPIYDSDYSASSNMPSDEEMKNILEGLSPQELIVALGSNPRSMESELAAMVIRDEADWAVYR